MIVAGVCAPWPVDREENNRFQGYFSLNYVGNKNKKQRKGVRMKHKNTKPIEIHNTINMNGIYSRNSISCKGKSFFCLQYHLLLWINSNQQSALHYILVLVYIELCIRISALLIQPNKFPILFSFIPCAVVSSPVLRFCSRQYRKPFDLTSVILERITQIKQLFY